MAGEEPVIGFALGRIGVRGAGADSQRTRPEIRALEAQAVSRAECALNLEGVIDGASRVRVVIGLIELGVHRNPVLREQAGGNDRCSSYRSSSRNIEAP